MNSLWFYHSYILRPFRSIHFFSQKIPLKEGILSLILVAATGLPQLSFVSATSLSFSWLLLILGLIVLLLFQSFLIDFFAQGFKGKAQSLKLFSWLCLSLLPFTLLTPFHLLLSFFTGLTPVIEFIFIGLSGISIAIQISTIRTLYHFSIPLTVFLYLVPFIFTLFFTGMITMGLGMALSAFIHL